jgi:hypothetical protein
MVRQDDVTGLSLAAAVVGVGPKKKIEHSPFFRHAFFKVAGQHGQLIEGCQKRRVSHVNSGCGSHR